MICNTANNVLLCGVVVSSPEYSHDNLSECYYFFKLAVKRLSDTEDILNILVPRDVYAKTNICCGQRLKIRGELRTYNKRTPEGNKLIISICARELQEYNGLPANEVSLCGTLCKPPVFRKTPLGREICDMMVAVNRRYNRADYLPCIAWGKNAKICGQFRIGCKVCINGRIQSREYIKSTPVGSETRTAFEISVTGIELSG